jgi:hypothetical protein
MEIDLKELTKRIEAVEAKYRNLDSWGMIKFAILSYVSSCIKWNDIDLGSGDGLRKTKDALLFIMNNCRETTRSFSLREGSRELLVGLLGHDEAEEIKQMKV